MSSLTILMTDRAPACIDTTDWKTIAEAHGDAYTRQPGAGRDQAIQNGTVDTYFLSVREHKNGRAIVHATLKATGGRPDSHAGELLDGFSPGMTMADAVVHGIKRVGETCQLPKRVIRSCMPTCRPRLCNPVRAPKLQVGCGVW